MNQRTLGIPGRRLLTAIMVGVTMIGLTLVPLSASAQAPSGTGDCIQGTSGVRRCSAGDLALGTFLAIVDDGCTSPSDTFSAIITAEVSSTANNRYDIGLWVNLLGDSALTPAEANDLCFREILHPVTTVPGAIDLLGGSGPFWDVDEDACGDLQQQEPTRLTLNGGEPITMPCRDLDGDGLADFSACVSYEQNQSVACTGFSDALPGAPPKCRCETVQLPNIPVPQLTIDKVCEPDVVIAGGAVICTITYANVGPGDAEGYRLVDDYDDAHGSVSEIQDTQPGDNSGSDDGDSITWQLPPIPATTGTGSVSYTYTVDGGVEAGTEIQNVAILYYDQDPIVDDDARVTVEAESVLAIQVDKTAQPASLPAPGGPVDFTVRVDNLSTEPVNLVSLVDDIHGNLDNQGSCSLPHGPIAIGDFYECSFSAAVSGDAGYSEQDTVTATATGRQGEVQALDDATVTIHEVGALAIQVTKTAQTTSLPEPGGVVDFTVRVDNLSTGPVDLLSLVDDIHGDLDTQGNCSLPQEDIAIDGFYQCSFSAAVTGDAGYSETDTVTAVATDGEEEAQAQDDATVSIREAGALAIEVAKTADPESLFEPGGLVDFAVRVDNLSLVPIDLISLIDDIHGDLDGQGNCSLPQLDIAIGDFYECTFSADVTGLAGYSETDTVTATATDGRRENQAQDDATVAIIVEPPDTGVRFPLPLVVGGLALVGIGLLAAGVIVRRRIHP